MRLQLPQLIGGFGDKEVVKVAAHWDGKHYLALTGDGEVYSWGNGDGGRLGHGDNMYVGRLLALEKSEGRKK